ncbi:MAG: hypothetical protein A2499_03950 [Stygiobacter sp. RIFOXYC12_FULL_38_8]|nr:MAG: hypothetical protein A2X62_00695 [Stygiobacter sp. GWC2_38_9]OGU84919.1 MAG: hypothetical protein A2279_08475 [Stygiobacter sp. RIFOXYA12_FULL_38_9]OGV06873.1 MAG: hypothetical protein A2299_03110 [Stygiobacter sp. RIFOXYB2_FULL_37_11]OGV11595.1 MAG: hypothetical protein A2237_04975 [Stygiobacter sp. RIFOXYA2_FULL_38_8]OGV13332.1 MAG: hypothetical protein A2440_13490 [Stygiobacter sp. RIFOXYC2_FULL_38_25]OGV30284.1 MAG: hypothetical protein A2499_03950 [Stygiobacter sp. RIFOXYC12_FULL_
MNSKLKILIMHLLLILISFSSGYYAQKKDDFRKIENKSFKVGEKLTFDVNYGFITAGVAEYNIPKVMKLAGRDVYQITFGVNTVSTFDALYKVRDRYETYVDVEGLFPWRFEQHIREGKYSRDFSAFFDQRKGKARTSEGAYEIPKYVNDIVSAFYFARTIDFSKMKKGESVHLENFYKDKTYPLDVVYKGKETVSVKAGTFDCIILEPEIKEGGLFKSEGNVVIWLSNDVCRIPVKVKTKIIIGSIDAELTGYSGLAGELKSKRK